jgi:hypothetical protein
MMISCPNPQAGADHAWGDDAVVKPVAVEQHKASLAHAQIQVMAPFGICNATRGSLGNRSTRVMRLSTDKNND